MSLPLVSTGSFAGAAFNQFIDCGLTPDVTLCKISGSAARWFKENSFFRRTSFFNVTAAGQGAILANRDNGFLVGVDTTVNNAGSTSFWLAFADNDSGLIQNGGYAGNQIDNRVVDLKLKPFDAMWIKRDNATEGVFKSRYMPDNIAVLAASSSASTGTYVRTINADGTFTVDASTNTNQWNGVTGLGESIEFTTFKHQDGVLYCKSYIGDGTTSRLINVGLTPCAAIVFSHDGNSKPEFATTDMAGSGSLDFTAGAFVDSLAFSGNSVRVSGPSVTTANRNGVTYTLIAFARNKVGAGGETQRSLVPTRFNVSGGRVQLLLNGLNSAIKCGADDSLIINGALTMEWIGCLMGRTGDTAPGGSSIIWPLIYRGNETVQTGGATLALLTPGGQGSASYGMFIATGDNGSWFGEALHILTTTVCDATNRVGDISYKPLSTGIVIPRNLGAVMHILVTIDANGSIHAYVNGRCVKERKLDLAIVGSAAPQPNIVSTSGHQFCIDSALKTGGTVVTGSHRVKFELARVYNVELSGGEAYQRFRYGFLGDPAFADVARGLVEEWKASRNNGTNLLALNNHANDGVVVNGQFITV